MQVVIPMAGMGDRCRRAGYKDPKPLIKVGGRPLVEHIVNMFDLENDSFLFICNSTHLRETEMSDVIRRICPGGVVVGIEPHKLGPVETVLRAESHLFDNEPVIIQYCDVAVYWDYDDFKGRVEQWRCDACAVANRGFHPHMLGPENYAFMRDDGHRRLLEIREKAPFTSDRMNEFASVGTHWFRSGALVKKYFHKMIENDVRVKGEFYVSCVHNLMNEANLVNVIYEVQHMLMWGTPFDVEIYREWSDYFRSVVAEPPASNSIEAHVLIPMAGRGSRFAGYDLPKPLVDVNGKPMVVQSTDCLPGGKSLNFVCLAEHLDNFPIECRLKEKYGQAGIVRLEEVTEGQACTCEIGIVDSGIPMDESLLISSCDHMSIFSQSELLRLTEEADVVVWGFKNNPASRHNPNAYGWLDVDAGGGISRVSVKKPISDEPYNDYAITGTFWFKSTSLFLDGLKVLYDRDIKTNNEFYVDNVVDVLAREGADVRVLDVNKFICLGTPADLKSYQYWQSFSTSIRCIHTIFTRIAPPAATCRR